MNLTGQIYDRLTVIEKAISIKGKSRWLCQCSCGNIKIINTNDLKRGNTKSCGCLNNELRKDRAKNFKYINLKYIPRIATARRVWKNKYKEMNFDDFLSLTQQNCFYCNSPPNNLQNTAKLDKRSSAFAKENGNFLYNGIDRIDSSKDHSDISNCVACCKHCNYAKRNRSFIDYINWINQTYSFVNYSSPKG